MRIRSRLIIRLSFDQRATLRIVSFDIGLNQRSMRESRLGIVDVSIGFVIEQHHGFVLRNDADSRYQSLEFVLQHPLLVRQIDLLASLDIAKQLLSMNASAMPKTAAIFSSRALQVLHVALNEECLVHVTFLENLQTLPDSLNRRCPPTSHRLAISQKEQTVRDPNHGPSAK